MKSDKIIKLINDVGACKNCTNLGDKSLINFYNTDMALKVPSIWTDFLNHLNSDLMIIGQDWGPYEDMKSLYERYKSGEDFNKLIDEEKSLTKRNLYKFIYLTNPLFDTKNIYITNAIMCARSGCNYRGNNIDLKHSTFFCSKFLKRQIDIVKPKVMVTLGFYPLLSLASVFDFEIEDNLTKSIASTPVISVSGYIIIPVYHPAAQVSLAKQLEQYKRIWDYL